MNEPPLTVDQILGEQPSILERAKLAREAAKEREAWSAKQEERNLIADLLVFLRDKLYMTPKELDQMKFTGDKYSEQRRQINFQLEGMDARARYEVAETYTTLGGQTITEYRLVVECSPARTYAGAWNKFTDLESLGKLLYG